MTPAPTRRLPSPDRQGCPRRRVHPLTVICPINAKHPRQNPMTMLRLAKSAGRGFRKLVWRAGCPKSPSPRPVSRISRGTRLHAPGLFPPMPMYEHIVGVCRHSCRISRMHRDLAPRSDEFLPLCNQPTIIQTIHLPVVAHILAVRGSRAS